MSVNSSFLIQIYTYHLLYYGAMYILEFFFLLCFKNLYLSFLYLFIHFLLLYKYESLLFKKKKHVLKFGKLASSSRLYFDNLNEENCLMILVLKKNILLDKSVYISFFSKIFPSFY